MIPLRSEKRISGFPGAVWLIAAMCTAALVRLASLPDGRSRAVLDALAVVPQRLLADPTDPGQLLTLVTGTFLHAGWLHLLSNMLYLLVFGPAVQARVGWKGFLGLYLASGSLGAIAFSLTHASSGTPLVGASGAIAGVLGAHLVLEPRARITTVIPVLVIFEVASLPAAFVIGLWFALQVAATVAPVVPGASDAGVAWMAHIGGFVAGVVLATPTAAVHAARSRAKKSGNRDRRTAKKRR